MRDPRLVQIADVIVNYSVGLKPGDKTMISGTVAGQPLLLELYRAAVRAGALVTTNLEPPGLTKIFLDEANEEQLSWVSPFTRTVLEEFDAYITYWGDFNSKEGTNYDHNKLAIRGAAMNDLQQKFIQRLGDESMRWCGTMFPTPAHAQDANMALEDFEEFVFSACLPDPDDPIAYWQSVEAEQDRIVDYLNSVKKIRLTAEGTDISFSVEGRTWINACGHLNMPDGEIYTSPVETETEGFIHFTFPSIFMGTEVQDIRLWFEKGKVIKATAAKGEAFLHSMLDRDEGARRVGELAIGTNPSITRYIGHTLFDEKIKGTAHLALGFGFPEIGGQNQSQIHWDIVCDLRNHGQIYADDTLIYENGDFIVDFE